MSLEAIIALSVGTIAMLVFIAIFMKCYKVKIWKSIPVAVMITITGTIGAFVFSFIESSRFGGRSYYGAVFLIPIVFHYVAKVLNIPYGELMDFCAPAGLVMLAIMKYDCLVEGCCGGKIMRVLEDGTEVLFPSQIAELTNALVLMLVIVWMGVSGKQHGKIYAWFLVLYGSTRFVLNLFRDESDMLLIGLPKGNIWSLVAIVIGIMWIKDYTIRIVKKEEKPLESKADYSISD